MATAREHADIARSVLCVALAAAVAGCSYTGPAPDPTPAPADTVQAGADSAPPAALKGRRVSDSFGNVDYYTTEPGDTVPVLSEAFNLSAAKIAEFNKLVPGAPLAAGTKLRLIPADVPIKGAEGGSTQDAVGVPLTYTAAPEDGTDGISYRFGLTVEQLDEANMFPTDRHTQLRPYLQAGRTIQLQKHPVGPRSGTGHVLYNMVGNPDYYWTVEGDNLEGIGYRVRRTRDQLLALNPGLAADAAIPPGTRLRLAPLDQLAAGAQGTLTADSQGLPETYTTAAGDTEDGVLRRFNLSVQDLYTANPAAQPGAPASYTYLDARSGTLAPGQTLSVDPNQPLRK